ncbi:MAG TPA: DUF4142 domain-containing protein [Caulobacteraceae bacterium]|jgi:putative membrane protein|nr:DUF4142 domain-containing protein [Caulobacteraceae bacterium]
MLKPSIAAAVAISAGALLFACKKTPDTNAAATNTAVVTPAPLPAGQPPAPSASPDVDFVTNAALSDMYEVQAGQYAQTHAQSPEVKKFAAEMVKAHTQTSDQLKALLPDAGVQVTIPSALDAKHRQMLDNLMQPGPTQFDRLYIAQQISAHTDAVALFTNYAQKGANAPLTAWAAKTLPIIQHHLDMANKLQTALK